MAERTASGTRCSLIDSEGGGGAGKGVGIDDGRVPDTDAREFLDIVGDAGTCVGTRGGET